MSFRINLTHPILKGFFPSTKETQETQETQEVKENEEKNDITAVSSKNSQNPKNRSDIKNESSFRVKTVHSAQPDYM